MACQMNKPVEKMF